ncbi:DegT/DnrJ/EryC1/StrS family aminotransferase, partial [Candidatus Pelagibacter sp.]|nr:DegT/DnrJ/EryC1/StrS family aminotransferase [Candidatus Pelagibacter sp.]
MINFWSYKREYKKIKNKILIKIDKTISKGNVFFGEELNNFEKKFLKKYNSKLGVAVGSGTDALLISLTALNIKKGDEIITAANTAIPTISAIINSGAVPKLVDIKDDYLIDPSKIEKQINKKTKAIIPVHLYGQSCDMDKIIKIAKKYNLKIIEDCAQAQGAMYKNKFVGTFGDFACFSFYPTKILGAYGDGGFIITKKFNDYKKIKRLRFYGIETTDKKNKFYNKYYANDNGFNSRLDEIQSSILNIKLRYIDNFINRRRKLANLYFKNLKETQLKLPIVNNYSKHVYHLFTVSHPQKNKIVRLLKKKKIGTRVIYPYPINKMKVYSKFNSKNNNL